MASQQYNSMIIYEMLRNERAKKNLLWLLDYYDIVLLVLVVESCKF